MYYLILRFHIVGRLAHSQLYQCRIMVALRRRIQSTYMSNTALFILCNVVLQGFSCMATKIIYMDNT